MINSTLLERHTVAVHEKSLNFKCNHCNKTFTLKRYLKDHVKRIHEGGNATMKCDICSKTFSYFGNLQRHKKNLHSLHDQGWTRGPVLAI